jgi:hypothetical protein
MKYTVMLLIGLMMIIPGINAFPDVGTSGTTAGDSVIILDIKTPQENGIFLNDVLPPHVWVAGEVKSPTPLRSIIISSSEGSTDCGNQSSFGCNVPAANGLNRIIVTATDLAGNHVSRIRDFTIHSGGSTQAPRITISGKITTPEGHPIAGATVQLESETLPVTVESETDGSYHINNAYGYHQKISVEKNGYTNVTKKITFDQNLNTLDFTLEPTTQPASGFTAVLCLVALLGSVLIVISRKERTR